MRLLLISIGSVVLTLFILLTARLWGQSQSYPEYVHPFFNQSPLTILQSQSIKDVQEAVKIKSSIVIQLPVRMSRDKVLYVLDVPSEQKLILHLQNLQKKFPNQQILKSQKIYDYQWEEINNRIRELGLTTELVTEFYKQFQNQKFILDVIDNTYEIDVELVKQLKDFHPDERTMIQSDVGTILSAVKMLKPEWLYGTSKADLVRMKTMQSMWILPAVQFKGDALIAPILLQNRPLLDQEIVSELRRRHKKIIVGPINNQNEFNQAQSYLPDGYLFLDARMISQ